MFRKLRYCFIFILLLVLVLRDVKKAWGQERNIFGIHVLETSDLGKAKELINSNGGDWGYVTIVIREDDLDKTKWQKFMDECRKLHLIPIVRIATYMETGWWAKPTMENLNKWHEFLNSLTWPVKQQIVVIFNEPNQAKEWGGEVNPRQYALVLERLISLLKDSNNNFFVLNGGLDQAADGRNGTMDEGVFLNEMQKAVPDIFNKLDGWVSHSYPNHGFVGLPENTGRRSIKGYEWELEIVKGLGGTKDLPVFITETGWPHQEGKQNDSRFYENTKVAQLIEKAFTIWGLDDRIKSVTPFVLNYPVEPFDHFSWLKEDGGSWPIFAAVESLTKNKNEPEQVEKYEIVKINLPDLLPTNYTVKAKAMIKNTGQWIMGERKNLEFRIQNLESENALMVEQPKFDQEQLIEPGKTMELNFSVQTGTQSAEHKLAINGKDYTIYVYKPFDLKNSKMSLWRQLINRLKLWWLEFREK